MTDARTDSGIGDGWFKISAAGLDVDRDTWAVTDLIEDLGEQEIPIPSCIEDGEYLLRAELIALHSAGSVGAAQLYMECAQIKISGGSGTKIPPTVSFPGEYSASDPGIHINIYQNLQSYDIPGPSVFTC